MDEKENVEPVPLHGLHHFPVTTRNHSLGGKPTPPAPRRRHTARSVCRTPAPAMRRDINLCGYIAGVTSSGGSSILMEDTAKAIASLHRAVRPRDLGRFARSALPETLVRSSLVIVLDEFVQHPRQVVPPEDQ